MAGVYAAKRVSGAALAVGERDQRVVNPPVDLDPLPRETRALAIRPLAGDADLGDALLLRSRLDRGDLGRQRAPIVFQRNEQIRLERDEEISGALLGRDATAEHTERVRRERQGVALVAAERQDRAASRGGCVSGGPAMLVDGHALGQRGAEPLAELESRPH